MQWLYDAKALSAHLRQVAGVVHRAQQQRAAVRHEQAVHLKPRGVCGR